MKENLMEIDRAKEPYTYITISSLEKMGKQIERLQEQLKEANHILKDVFISDAYYKSKRAQYLKKWGVK